MRREVEQARTRDGDFPGAGPQAAVLTRVAALVDEQRAVARGEVGSRYALRAAAVDLAAAAELAAAELPAPAPDRVRRSGWNIGDTTP